MRLRSYPVSRAAMLGCCSVIAMAVAGGARAAEAAAASDQGSRLDEVVVTAQRVDQKLQKVPVAETAFSPVALQKHSITDIEDVQFHVPDLSIIEQADNGSLTIGMRGINVSAATFSFDSAVGVYINGVFVARANDLNSAFFDVGNLQVLRGPQGTLFGRDTPVGAILIDTKRPGSTYGGYLEAGVGAGGGDIGQGSDRTFYHFEGAVDLPVAPNLNLRLAGYHIEDNGYAQSTVSGYRNYSKDDSGVRATAVYTPTEKFSATVILDYNHRNDGEPMFVPIGTTGPLGAQGYDLIHGGTAAQDALTALIAHQNPYTDESVAQGQGVHGESYSATILLDYRLSDVWNLRSITGYRHLDSASAADNTPIPFVVGGPTAETLGQSQVSQEFVLDGNLTKNLHVLAGVYYFDETGFEQDLIQSAVIPTGLPPPFPGGFVQPILYAAQNIDNSSTAGFINLAYTIVPNLTISGGVRYSEEDKSLDVLGKLLPSVALPTGLTAFSGPHKISAGVPVYDAKLTWQAIPDLLLYFSYGTGYRAGGIGFRAPSSEFTAETSDTYELGAKWDFNVATMPARLNAALFDTNYKNFQVSVTEVDPLNPLGVSQDVINAGAATIKGAELEFSINPTQRLSLSSTLSLLDAHYDSFIYPLFPAGTADLKNNQLREAPKVSWGLSGSYTMPTSAGDVVTTLDYAYSSSYEVDPVYQTHAPAPLQTNQFRQSPTNIVNARVTLAKAFGSNVDISIWGKNLTDQVRLVDSFNISNLNEVAYGEPRSIGIEARANF
jgi:iron complex outermembrane recepter protein